MSKVSFKYGTASQLTNAPYSEGTFYVISDSGSTDGILYADLNNKRICFGDVASLEDDVSELSSSIPTKISELVDDSDFIKQYYGTCGTAAATVQKEVTINSITELTTGLTIFVKFTYANTAADPTLKLNNFDTKYIKRYGTTAPGTSVASSWNAGGIVCLTYDGTYWYLNDWNNTTYSAMSESEMKTGTATTGRNITAARLKQAVEYHAPVSSVNGQTGEVSITIPTVPTNVSDFTNDAGYLTSYTETDPTVPSWAKQSTKPTYTAAEVGAVPFDAGQAIATLEGGVSTLRFASANTVNRYVQIYVDTNSPSIALQSKYGNAYPLINSVKLKGIASPQDSTDAANKDYVDNAVSGLISQETDPTVPSWAKTSTKPSYNFSEIGSTPTTVSGYGITDVYTKTQVDGLVAGVLHYKGTKAAVSNLPTSGNTTGDTWHITADGSEWAWDGTTWQELGTAVDLSDYVTTDDSRLSDARTPTAHNQALSTITGADDLKAIEALSGTSGLLKKTAANTWTLDSSNYLTSYTETDPVFSASAAAEITSADISNWNAKVSDDKTWNGVTLNKTNNTDASTKYIPTATGTNSTSMNYTATNTTGLSISGGQIPQYDTNGYLYVETPDADAGFRAVANKNYVDSKIPSQFVSNIQYNSTRKEISMTRNNASITIVTTATLKSDMAYSSSNTNGFLTLADLPIYDGTVV